MADAAVDEHLRTPVDCRNHIRECVQGGDRAVDLATTMVGNDDRLRPVIDREHGIIRVQDAFRYHWERR